MIKPTAEKTGTSEELVQDITSFFWTEVRRSVVEMRGHNVFVESLGTFRVKSWKVPEAIQEYERRVADYEKKIEEKVSFQKFAILKELQSRLNVLVNVQKMIQQDEEKKQQVKNKRNAELKRDLESPETDS